MKKADLVIGVEYAVAPYATADRASRVRLLRLGAGTEAEVRILAGVPMFLDADWKQGAVVTTSTRKITCTWAEWASGAEVRDRRREERNAQAAERERQGDAELMNTGCPDSHAR